MVPFNKLFARRSQVVLWLLPFFLLVAHQLVAAEPRLFGFHLASVRKAQMKDSTPPVRAPSNALRKALCMDLFGSGLWPEGYRIERPVGSILYWDIKAHELVHPTMGSLVFASGAVFTNSGQRAAAISREDGSVTVWDTRTTRRLYSVPVGFHQALGLAFSHDDTKLAIALRKKLLLIDVASGANLMDIDLPFEILYLDSLFFREGARGRRPVLTARTTDGRDIESEWSEEWGFAERRR